MRKIRTIILLVLIIILVPFLIIKKTYSLIDNVNQKDIKLIFISNGEYTEIYYKVRDKLELDDNNMNKIINSNEMNNLYNDAIKKKMDNDKLYEVIKKYVLLDDKIEDNLKSKIINVSKKYINEIREYLYK